MTHRPWYFGWNIVAAATLLTTLERADEAYQKMKSGDVKFCMVLTMADGNTRQ